MKFGLRRKLVDHSRAFDSRSVEGDDFQVKSWRSNLCFDMIWVQQVRFKLACTNAWNAATKRKPQFRKIRKSSFELRMSHFVRWTSCGKIRRHDLAGGTKPRKDGWIRLFDCFSFCGGAAIAGVQPACILHKAYRKTVQKIWSSGLSIPSFPGIAQRQTQLRLFLRGENLNRQLQKNAKRNNLSELRARKTG